MHDGTVPQSWLFAGLFESTRPISSAVAGTLSLTAVVLRRGFSLEAVWAGGAMCAATMFGFVLNDVLDFRKDAAAGVRRPIARGLVSRRAALVFAVVLLLVAGGLAAMIGEGRGVLLMTALALVLYTPVARGVPVLKGMYVALLCLAPLYYGAVVAQARVPGAVYAVDALFIFGREMLMDADEVAGDRMAGMRTIAAVAGARVARGAGAVIMVLALVSLNLVARGLVGRVAAACSVVSLLLVLLWPRLAEDRRIAWSRMPMLAAAIALASG